MPTQFLGSYETKNPMAEAIEAGGQAYAGYKQSVEKKKKEEQKMAEEFVNMWMNQKKDFRDQMKSAPGWGKMVDLISRHPVLGALVTPGGVEGPGGEPASGPTLLEPSSKKTVVGTNSTTGKATIWDEDLQQLSQADIPGWSPEISTIPGSEQAVFDPATKSYNTSIATGFLDQASGQWVVKGRTNLANQTEPISSITVTIGKDGQPLLQGKDAQGNPAGQPFAPGEMTPEMYMQIMSQKEQEKLLSIQMGAADKDKLPKDLSSLKYLAATGIQKYLEPNQYGTSGKIDLALGRSIFSTATELFKNYYGVSGTAKAKRDAIQVMMDQGLFAEYREESSGAILYKSIYDSLTPEELKAMPGLPKPGSVLSPPPKSQKGWDPLGIKEPDKGLSAILAKVFGGDKK